MLFLCFFFSFGLLAYAQSLSSLGNLPLAVKTPYLYGWVRNNDHKAPEHVWPRLFAQDHILGWNAMIRVDGQPYQWLGDTLDAGFSTTAASEITPTSTIFTIQAGPMKFKATFFTPVEPNNYTRQSIPFTYLFVDGFTADDGNPHTIQLYSDITGQFISHGESTQMKWVTRDSSANMVYHRIERSDPIPLYDNADSAEDATAYYATPKRSGLTWQTGDDTDCRGRFAQNGSLTNVKDINFRPVNTVLDWPYDLGEGYPTINGNAEDTEEYAIEHCGNMLIMAYAHAAKSGDGSLISKYHSLLQKWADYLVQTSLHSNTAKSADDISYPGMSNLVLKGILGVYFMGKIDEVVNNSSNTTFKANELFEDWKRLAVIDTHIKAEYGKPDTWGLTYNLFPAIWLQTGLVDDVLNREAQFYHARTPPGNQSYSLDNGAARDDAYPHWALTTAAIIPSGFTPVRDTLIRSTYLQAYNVSQTIPLPKRYKVSTGDTEVGTLGNSVLCGSYTSFTQSWKTPAGAVVGGVIGGLALLLVIAGAILFWRRRQVQQHVIGLRDEGNHNLQPFMIPSSTPVNRSDNASEPRKRNPDASRRRSIYQGPFSKPFLDPQRAGRLYSNDMERNNQSPVANNVAAVSPPQSLSNRQREIIRQNRSSTAGSVREEALRAEMDELRREVEAIRHIAQPPPCYQ